MYAVGTQATAAQRTRGDGTSCEARQTTPQRHGDTPKPELYRLTQAGRQHHSRRNINLTIE